MTYPKSILYLILALALARGIIYAAVVPPWQAPDEPAQFERARAAVTSQEWASISEDKLPWYDDLVKSMFLFDYSDYLPGRRQTYSPDSLLNRYLTPYQEVYGGLYGSQPPYALIGWPLFLVHQQDITLQLYLVRLNTVLMNVAIIFFAFLMTRTIFPNDPFLIFGVPSLILFNPQHTHNLSTVNNGNLAELLTIMALYFLVRATVTSLTWVNGLAILGLTLLAMWTKATAFFLPLVIGVLILFYLWRYRRRWRWMLPAVLILPLLIIYFFSPERLRLLAAYGWEKVSAGSLYLDPIVLRVLFRSFWAMPGSLVLQLHPFWYQLLAATCLLALAGLAILIVTRWPTLVAGEYQPQVRALVLLAVAAIASIGILLAWNTITNTITYRQGRSIYPVTIAISIFLMLGWRQLIPVTWRNFGLLAITAALFLFDTMVLFQYIFPFFYSRY